MLYFCHPCFRRLSLLLFFPCSSCHHGTLFVRFHGVMVGTLDSESSDPSSNQRDCLPSGELCEKFVGRNISASNSLGPMV